MRCFNHPETESIGICKSCQRGLCLVCATDLQHGLACKGKHEQEVAMLNTMIDQSAKIHSFAPWTRNAAPLFCAFIGAVFAGFGLLRGRGLTDPSVILGSGFVVFAIYSYIYNKKAYASKG
jgi:D-arabinose 1-dehydrogenase-like Zn-dependent alcohol dehydrogenase